MLSQERRLRTRDINRMFARLNTQKIPVYPFVYFVGPQSMKKKKILSGMIADELTQSSSTKTQRGIQLPNKLLKTSVERHMIKRLFYDCVHELDFSETQWCVLAIPQKKWAEDLTQLLATVEKTRILQTQKQAFLKSLSLFSKKLGDLSNESKK